MGDAAMSDPFDTIEAFYERYGEAFNTGDLVAIEAMFDYPWLLSSAAGVRQIEADADPSAFYATLLASLRQRGWARSTVESFAKFRMGVDGALIAVDFARLRDDGSVLETGRAGYFLRDRPDGWKIAAIVDGLGG